MTDRADKFKTKLKEWAPGLIIGVFVCTALYYGCMRDECMDSKFSSRPFILMVFIVAVCFTVDQLFWRYSKNILSVDGKVIKVFEKATYEDYVVESLNKYHDEALKKASDSGIYDTTIEADVNMLHDVQSSIRRMAESVEYNKTKLMQLDLVVEEIFVNIASYAYTPYKGNVTVRAELVNDDTTMKVTFIDKGREYNPLAKEDPDVTAAAKDRTIGGLGIYLTKQLTEDQEYEFVDMKNVFTFYKNII